jgi:anthranilate/para-aminobenzoate synthase component II
VKRGPALNILHVGVCVERQQVAHHLGGLLESCQVKGSEASLDENEKNIFRGETFLGAVKMHNKKAIHVQTFVD